MARMLVRLRRGECRNLPKPCTSSPTTAVPLVALGWSYSTAMVDDKYIGLALAVSSSLAIGTSYIITKKVRARRVFFRLSDPF
jgi:hypothetical protein